MKKTIKLALDQTDKQILQLIQINGRIPIAQLADEVSLSASACARRLRLLEDAQVIRGYGARLDESILGLPLMALVRVSLNRKTDDVLATFEAAITKAPEVMEAYLMTGRDDYILRVVVADMPAYEHFLRQRLTRIAGVSQIESSFMLRQVAHRAALPVPPESD